MKIHWKIGKELKDGVREGAVLNAVVKNGETVLVTKGTDGKWYEVPLNKVIV